MDRQIPRLFQVCMAALLVAPTAAMADDGVKVGRTGVTLKKGDLTLNVGGRLHVDSSIYSSQNDDVTDASIRRARVEIAGKIGKYVRFRVDREFGGGDSRGWRNVWASVRPSKGVEVKGGNFNVPFSMEEMQSSNSSALVERSLVSALAPGYGLGGSVSLSKPNWTVTIGYFGAALSNESGRSKERGRGVAARFTMRPMKGDGQFLHLGAAVERRGFHDGEVLKFSAQPGTVLAPDILGTGSISRLDTLTNIGGEVAYARRSALVQGQYVSTRIRRIGVPSINFSGWYVQASWLVTGQNYGYSKRGGYPSGPKLKHGKGAVELATRYSHLDLESGPIDRGIADTVTLGVNWYVNRNVRLMLDYGHGATHGSNRLADRSVDLGVIRFQVSF
jgi:phosphate-selective porin OprO and OprP